MQSASETDPNEPLVAILCVTHGRPDLVRKCLQSCARQDYGRFEIVTIINPRDAASESAVREAAPLAKVIRTHRNLGFFPALNIAMANTDAQYLMVIDDDARFLADDALSRLVDQFRREPNLGAVTCNLEGPHETPIDQDRYIRVFTTGFTMMPREVVIEWVGYVPDVFFRSAGETFWCMLLWEQRRPVKRVEAVRMYHALAQQGRSVRDWRFYRLRSQILCALMREPASWIVPVLASKFVKSLIQYIRCGAVGVWFHAWFSACGHFPEAARYRTPVSVVTRRLLRRLEAEPVHDLTTCQEWLDAARASELKSPGLR
jgi:GT2 family glycosyltransferase